MTMALLEITNMTKTFGGLKAISDVTFSLEKGRIVSIIGPNGAGKTTFFNTLTGIYKPDGGTIKFNGKSLVGLRPDQIAARGIARTFQNIRLFPDMTVIENILVGMHIHFKQSPIQTLFRLPGFKKEEAEGEKRAAELMQYVGLKRVENELAKNLPYGAQRRLEIARALAAEPLLLLLDEPAAGMNPQETEDVIRLFRRNQSGHGDNHSADRARYAGGHEYFRRYLCHGLWRKNCSRDSSGNPSQHAGYRGLPGSWSSGRTA